LNRNEYFQNNQPVVKHLIFNKMSETNETNNKEPRNYVAVSTLIFSGSAIIILAATAIIVNPKEAMTIFNIALPVFASWVGTILAFYFGKVNFESANKQVGDMLARTFSPEDLNKTPVKIIMRQFVDMECFKMPVGKSEKDILLSELHDMMNEDKNRLPVVSFDSKPLYMVHLSTIRAYTSGSGKLTDTLEQFLASKRGTGSGFGLNEGFIIVPENSALSEAKERLDKIKICQDIFITKDGTANEPLTGWVSNTRMARLLQI
jgi:hypothetical protein